MSASMTGGLRVLNQDFVRVPVSASGLGRWLGRFPGSSFLRRTGLWLGLCRGRRPAAAVPFQVLSHDLELVRLVDIHADLGIRADDGAAFPTELIGHTLDDIVDSKLPKEVFEDNIGPDQGRLGGGILASVD